MASQPFSPPSSPRRRAQTDRAAAFREVGPYWALGWQIAASMAFFVLVGYLLDRQFGTAPWLLLAGAFWGLIALFLQIYRLSVTLDQKARAKRISGERSPKSP